MLEGLGYGRGRDWGDVLPLVVLELTDHFGIFGLFGQDLDIVREMR